MLIQPLNIPGRHCASSGLRNLAAHHGLGWTEAMCFGLGAGLGVWYIKSKSPSRMIHVRSADLEEQFFIRINAPLPWNKYETPEQSQKDLMNILDAGHPAIIQTDIFHLPYYQSSTHFPGHVITAWGYDLEKQVFLVTDTERPDLIEVAFEDIAKARFCGDAFFNVKGNCMAPESMTPPPDMAKAIREAIIFNSRVIMDPAWPVQGVAGLNMFIKELDLWAGFADWQWAFRFAYQVFEKRGTGGGGFRLMYLDFLEEALAYLPEVGNLGLPQLMGECAQAWTALASALKDASEKEEPEISEIRVCLDKLIQTETAYHQTALTLA
ncbi:MAG: BtrH N-terminal domain-containing protein [Desulfatibacillum sp.]|nr:BtrH N-terminal domain-containing protein [Desulfatibacillum sp.]